MTKHKSNFSSSNTDIPAYRICTNVPRQFSHEALAKRITSLSDLPLGSKSAPPFPPPIGNVVKLF
jgi:hypothetical protein